MVLFWRKKTKQKQQKKSTKKPRSNTFILEEIISPGAYCPIPIDDSFVNHPIFELFTEQELITTILGTNAPINITDIDAESLVQDYWEKIDQYFQENPSEADAFDINNLSTWPTLEALINPGKPPVELPDVGGAVDTLPPPVTIPIDPPRNNYNQDYDFPVENQPLVGVIDTGFSGNNPDIDYSRITLGSDRLDNDNNPLLTSGEGNEHGTHVVGIIGATRNNDIGIDGINDNAPLWLGRAIGSGKWAESLVEFVDAARESGKKNAVMNLSLDLTQTNPDGTVTTRYELTPQERNALEYARQNGVLVVAAAGNTGSTMSALGQASQEFDNLITVGSIDSSGNKTDYSSFGYGLDLMAQGGTFDNPIQSLMGDGSDLDLFTLDEEVPPDEMSTNVQTVIDEVFAPLSDENWEDENEELPEYLTEEERKVYEEVTQEIDFFLQDYLKDASEKIAVEFADAHYAASTELLEEFLDAFDEDMAETLVKAEEILGNDTDGDASGESDNLDFSVPLDFGVGNMAGTSVAAAKVTGVVSQVWAANPDLSFVQVKEILKQTALDINTPGWDRETGAGVVNIEAAVELAKQTKPETYTPDSLKSPTRWSGEGQVIPGERAVSVSVPAFTGRVMSAGYVTWTGWLRVRSGPGTNYPQVGLKYPGNAIQFDAYENNGRWVPDPYMPGGGSSRWYRIAGTNHWISALYIDNTPEKAAEERRRQEEIRRAEEEARRAEEEARRAEEEARRAAEELRRLEEEQRRREEALRVLKQQQFQDAVSQLSEKFGDLGNPLSESLSNGVNVYEFAKGKLFTQPDGRYGFYEVGKNVGEFFNPNVEGSGADRLLDQIWNENHPLWSNLANGSSSLIDDADNLAEIGKILAYQGYRNSPDETYTSLFSILKHGKPGEFITPRFGKSQYFDDFLSIPKNLTKNWDDFITGKTSVVNSGKNSFTFTTTKGALPKRIQGIGKAGTIGPILGFVPIAYEVYQAGDNQEEIGKALIKGGAGILGGMAGASIGAALLTPVGLTPVGAVVGGVVGGAIGEYAGELVGNNWGWIREKSGDAWNATTSAFDQTLKAAREKAKATKEKAEALAKEAKATYQTAKAKVQEAKVAYQQFKEETQQKVTQIVQQSKQKIKKAAQQALQRAAQKAPRVVQKVANYARRAAKTVGQVINGVKQFTNKIIDVGKKAVRQVIDTGKRAYEATKKFVSNTYNKGKEVARQAYNTVKNTVSSGFNRVKSWFGL